MENEKEQSTNSDSNKKTISYKGNEIVKLDQSGRPSIYTDDLALKICMEISTSTKSLRTIAGELGISVYTILNWLNTKDEFLKQYTRAKQEQADLMVEQIIEIADDSSQDTITIYKDGKPVKIEDKEWTNRSRLRVDSRKWIASKLKPKKYGDKIELSGDQENPVQLQIIGMKVL